MGSDPCAQDGQLMGPCSLFLGAETATWTTAQFVQAAQFAKQHGISTLIIKCSEVTSKPGDIWYGGMAGVDRIVQAVLAQGVRVLTYQFMWGNLQGALATEISVAQQFLSKYNKHCLDMEGSTWAGANGQAWASQMNATLVNAPGKLFVSCPADPIRNDQFGFLRALSPSINIWMPMAYSNALDSIWQGDYHQINSIACLQPTLDLSPEFGPNDPVAVANHFRSAGCHAISIWEYQFAVSNPALLDKVVTAFKGGAAAPPHPSAALQLNAQGMVLDIAKTYQLVSGESQDLCGPWCVASLTYAGLPGKGPRGTAEQIHQDADKWADKWLPGGHISAESSSIPNMFEFLEAATDPQGGQRNLHWWDITPDVAHITSALKAGYPVIITANEQNIIEKRSGQRPYPWNLDVNHILPVLGLDKDGDFICADQLNDSFQGYWPPVYLASRLNPSWATVVLVVGPDPNHPWLKPIPSGDPPTWPHGFNGQNF